MNINQTITTLREQIMSEIRGILEKYHLVYLSASDIDWGASPIMREDVYEGKTFTMSSLMLIDEGTHIELTADSTTDYVILYDDDVDVETLNRVRLFLQANEGLILEFAVKQGWTPKSE